MTEETSPIVLLDRVEKGFRPDYCLHGQVTCVRCGQWCHMGHETSKVIERGEAKGLCLTCVKDLIADGTWPADARPRAQLEDHKRADGPHEEFSAPEGWVQVDCANPRCVRQVWAPPVETNEVPVLRTCSAACADDCRRDFDRDRG